MLSKEYKSHLLRNEDLTSFQLSPLPRAVENPNLQIFTATRLGEKFLVKRFRRDHLEAAKREEAQYALFAELSFIPRLEKIIESSDGTYFVYQYIDGTNLYDAQRAGQVLEPLQTYQTVIDQTIQLSNTIPDEYYEQMKHSGTNFSLTNPLVPDVLTPEQEQEFNHLYSEVIEILKLACQYFPGMYSDRNPGNILIDNKNMIYQVDFGVIEATSPLFDLSKLLRTATGEPSTQDLEADVLQEKVRTVKNPAFEMQIVGYTYNQLRACSKHAFTGSEDLFKRGYLYAALNEHIFYLSKAIKLLRSGQSNQLVQSLRLRHHHLYLPSTLNQLILMGEPIDHLRQPIAYLVESAEQLLRIRKSI